MGTPNRSFGELVGWARLRRQLWPIHFRAARAITREHAKTFYFASHVLSESVRQDAYAVYACCRSIDDVVDQGVARGETVRPEVAGELLLRAFESGGNQPGEEWMPAFRDTISRKNPPAMV